jgi:hypothetical protein
MTWELIPLTRDAAMAFVLLHHRHCRRAAAHRGALGLMIDGTLTGVVIIGNTCKETMKRHPLRVEVTRLCVPEGAPRGACSWLYARARRAAAALGFREVTTCTLDEESGASLRGAGWTVVGELPARKGKRAGYGCATRPRETIPTDGRAKRRWMVTA